MSTTAFRRGARILFAAAFLPAVLSGCFLFGGDEDDEKKKPQDGTSYMDPAGGSAGSVPLGAIAEPPVDSGSSSPLPMISLGVSVITLIMLIVHMIRSRRRHADPGV